MARIETQFESIRAERGATVVEYGLLIAFIAIAIIAGLATLGPSLADVFQSVVDGLSN